VNLVLLERGEIRPDGTAAIGGPRARHLLTVLKVKPEQSVRAGLIDGPLGTATVLEIRDDVVILACQFEREPPPRPPVDLLIAVPRPKVLRRLWAQLAALGVGEVMLTNAARVERNYFDTHWLAPAIYTPLLIEGLQQARDTRLPVVSVHRRFRPLIEDRLADRSPEARVVAHPGDSRTIADAVGASGARRLLIAIGPEGGWNAFELGLLEAKGFTTIAMGARTLRTDTACVALLALAHDALARQGQP
jgi:RsmE family RNA methyltransferase